MIIGSPISCDWFRDNSNSHLFYSRNDGCTAAISTDEYSTNCEAGENFINFIYTIHSSLQSDVDYGIGCFNPNLNRESILIQVKGNLATFKGLLDVFCMYFRLKFY